MPPNAQIGRFWGIDPASQFPSGYTGMANNPANMIDPSGMDAKPSYYHPMYDQRDRLYINFASGISSFNEDDVLTEDNVNNVKGGSGTGDAGNGNNTANMSLSELQNYVNSPTSISSPQLNILLAMMQATIDASLESDNPLNDGPAYALAGDGDGKGDKDNDKSDKPISIDDLMYADLTLQVGRVGFKTAQRESFHVGFMSNTSPYGVADEALGKADQLVNVVQFTDNLEKCDNGELSIQRFTYRATGLLTGAIVEQSAGFTWGTIANMSFGVGEFLYDFGKWYKDVLTKTSVNWQTNFSNWARSATNQ